MGVLVREDVYDLVSGPMKRADFELWRLGYFCHPRRTTWMWSDHVNLRRSHHFDASPLATTDILPTDRNDLTDKLLGLYLSDHHRRSHGRGALQAIKRYCSNLD